MTEIANSNPAQRESQQKTIMDKFSVESLKDLEDQPLKQVYGSVSTWKKAAKKG